jgi:hypothetical protein
MLHCKKTKLCQVALEQRLQLTIYVCPPPPILDSSIGQMSKNSCNEILILHQNVAYIKYTYHYVCSNIGHILLHDYVVKLDSWLIPLVIVMVIVSFAINHVTFITTMTFIITVGKHSQIISLFCHMKCRHMFKHNKATLTINLHIY